MNRLPTDLEFSPPPMSGSLSMRRVFVVLFLPLVCAQLYVNYKTADEKCECPEDSLGERRYALLGRCSTANAILSLGDDVIHACNPAKGLALTSSPPQEYCLICYRKGSKQHAQMLADEEAFRNLQEEL